MYDKQVTLLSKDELSGLLDESETVANVESLSFEKRMGRVSLTVSRYFKSLGLGFEELRMVKSISNQFNNYYFKTEYEYLEGISIDNSLALGLLAVVYGAEKSTFSLERKLSYLERRLIEQLFLPIVESVKQELHSYFEHDDGLKIISDYSLLLSQGLYQGAIDFIFSKELFVASSVIVLDAEPLYKSGGTKVEAIIGTVSPKSLESRSQCSIDSFDETPIVLLFDHTLAFKAIQKDIQDTTSLFIVEEPFEERSFLSSYYIVIAGGLVSDEMLLSLSYGEKIALTQHVETEIHKDGTMVAKAKVTVVDGAIALEII